MSKKAKITDKKRKNARELLLKSATWAEICAELALRFPTHAIALDDRLYDQVHSCVGGNNIILLGIIESLRWKAATSIDAAMKSARASQAGKKVKDER